MIEWLLILAMATLGLVAFAILSKAGPVEEAAVQSDKVRKDLQKLIKKEEEKKKAEKFKEKAEKVKAREEDKKKAEKKSSRSPPKQRAPEPPVQPELEEEESNAIYIPNVPIKNDTPTTKPLRLDTRSRSPLKAVEEAPAKKEVVMPDKKRIERDMQKGFVVVQKKGPPPLTPEQRKERDALRQKEEEEEKRREAEALAREKDREKRRAEQSLNTEVSLEEVKAKLDKQKQEKMMKDGERKQVKGVVKSYTKVAQEAEEQERRGWGAAVLPEGEEPPSYDAEDYPRLQPSD